MIPDIKYEMYLTNAYAVLTKEEASLCLIRWIKEAK